MIEILLKKVTVGTGIPPVWRKNMSRSPPVRESSIVQVVAEQDVIQTLRPYTRIGTKLVAGSGVIVDAREGLIISNAHVTENAVNVTVFSAVTGKVPLHCELVSILREKDLSLLRIIPEDRKLLFAGGRRPEELNARLVDHLQLRQGAHLYAAGFPLGTRHLQVTTGCLSGLSTGDSYVKLTQYEDALQREPTFIVTSAGLNHGMSGGGLFDESGGLVGIITAGIPGASQIGFAIPSRVVLANFREMLSNITPIPTNLHFRWSNVSAGTASHLSGGSQATEGGMMIRHVLPDSVFHNTLKRGDLLHSLEFDLPNVESDSLISSRGLRNGASVTVTGEIESHGDVTLKRSDGKDDERLSARKFSIPEIVDYMIAGSKLGLHYSRSGSRHSASVDFAPNQDVFRVRGYYHVLQAPQWIKVGGVVMQNTSLNNLAECSRYKYITEIPYYDDLLFTPSVIITYVEPSSEIGSLSSFAEGDIVVFVDGREVRSVDDIHRIVEELPEQRKSVAVETDRGAIAICPLEDSE